MSESMTPHQRWDYLAYLAELASEPLMYAIDAAVLGEPIHPHWTEFQTKLEVLRTELEAAHELATK